MQDRRKLSHPGAGGRAVPLVGRNAELEAIEHLLCRVVAGEASVLLLEGEAGIGKSRLLAEGVDRAQRRGLRLLSGVADELSRNRPFGVLTDALKMRRSSDPRGAALRALLTGDAAGGPMVEWTSPAPDLSLRVLEAILGELEEMAAEGPVILALEDLHWADVSSLAVVRAVVRRLAGYPVGVLGTLRPNPRIPELDRVLDDLAESGAVRRTLAPLDEPAVWRLVAEVLDTPPAPELMDRMRGAAGNPLYTLELARTLLDDGALEIVGGQAHLRHATLPSAFVDLVRRRLRFLSEPALEALQVASVLGPTFSITDLAMVLGRSATDLLGIVREAMAAGLLKEAETRLAFRHALVQEAVYSQLPLALRSSLHGQVGWALADAGAPAGQVAHHLVLGAERGDAEAADWLEKAAREAAPHAPATAADLLARAVELVDPADPSNPRLVQLLAARSMSLAWAGCFAESQEVALQALAGHPGGALEAEIRLGLGRSLLAQGFARQGVEELDTAAGLSGLDEGLRAEAWAEASLGRLFCGDLAAAGELAERAVAAGRAAGNHLATCAALCASSMVAQSRGAFADGVELGLQAVEEADGDPSGAAAQHHPWWFLGIALMRADRFDEARETFEAGRRRTDQIGARSGLPLYHMALAIHHFQSGRWDDATTELEATIAYEKELGGRAAAVWASIFQAELNIHRGDLSTAEVALAEARAMLTDFGVRFGAESMLPALAHLRRAQGDPEGALALLEQAWHRTTAVGMVAELGTVARELVSLACATGRRELAAAVTEVLETRARQCPLPRLHADLLRCQGLLRDDPALILEAVGIYRLGPRCLPAAEALEDAAAVLGRTGRVSEVQPFLEEALDTYERLEARWDVARVLATLRGLGIRKGRRGPRQRPKVGWQSLTETEHQVVQLVTDGLSNARIGERLFVSRRTVETHLSHVFVKLGVASRKELALAASGRLET